MAVNQRFRWFNWFSWWRIDLASDWELLPINYHLISCVALGTIVVNLSTGIIVTSTIGIAVGKYFISL